MLSSTPVIPPTTSGKNPLTDGQLRECMIYAERKGLTVIRSYIDRALSAKTDARPQFQKMIKDSNARKFEVILVWKLDRFSRNRYD